MSKKKNAAKAAQKPVPAAPAVEKPAEKKPTPKKEEQKKPESKVPATTAIPSEQEVAKNILQAEYGGMDPNRRADVTRMLFDYYHVDNGSAARKMGISDEVIEKMDRVTMISATAEMAIEMQYSKTPFALTVKKAVLGDMADAFKELGFTMSGKVLELPADKNGNVVVHSEDVKASKEAKEAVKKTVEARNKKVITDPTKIENDDQLKESLQHMLAANTFFKDFKKTLNFYRSVRQIQNKNDKVKAEAYKNMPFDKLIKEIEDLILDCPFIVGGYGNHLFEELKKSGSVILPFSSLYLNAKSPTVGDSTMTENEVAGICRALINWKIDKEIATKNKSLAALNKDKKANKDAIVQKTQEIADLENYRTLLTEPTADFADNLLTNRKSDDKTVSASARRAYTNIRRAYYPETDRGNGKKYTNIDENVQQRAGIIANLFRDPTVPLGNYNVGNLTDLIEVDDSTEEKKPEEKKEDSPKK